MKHHGIHARVGVTIGTICIAAAAAMGVLSGCADEVKNDRPATPLTPTEKNLSPTGGNLFSPGGPNGVTPTTTTTPVNGTNSNSAPKPSGPPGHGDGRGAAGPNGPGSGPGGGPGGGGPGGGGGGGR